MTYCKQSTDVIHTLKHQCKSLKHNHQTHTQIITRGLLTLHPSSASGLLTSILHTLNSLLSAIPQRLHPLSSHYPLSVFNLIPNPSTFCWNTIIRSHTLFSLPHYALFLFVQMRRERVLLDAHTFPFVLKACAQLNDRNITRTVHCQCFKHGFVSDVFVCNNLVRVYCNCGRVGDAYKVFDESPVRDVVSYNVILDGFVKVREVERARRVFDEMDVSVRDATTWGMMLAGYAQMKDYDQWLNLLCFS